MFQWKYINTNILNDKLWHPLITSALLSRCFRSHLPTFMSANPKLTSSLIRHCSSENRSQVRVNVDDRQSSFEIRRQPIWKWNGHKNAQSPEEILITSDSWTQDRKTLLYATSKPRSVRYASVLVIYVVAFSATHRRWNTAVRQIS